MYDSDLTITTFPLTSSAPYSGKGQFADMLLSIAAVLWKQQLQMDPSNCSQAVATQMRLKSIWERAR
jgi:hypothetical protein